MIRNGKAIDHSNVGGVWGSLVATIVCFALFVASLYVMGMWTLHNAWVPGLIALALATIAFAIPKAILGRGDTLHTNAIHGAQPLAAQPAPVVRAETVRTTTARAAGAHSADRH